MERQSWLDANFVCYVIQGSRLTQQLLLLRHSPKAIGFLICICSHRLFSEKITSSSYAFSERAALKHEIGNPETETNHGARSIQPNFPEISVQNSMDRFGPTGKVSKKRVHLLRWSSFPGRTGWNFGWIAPTETETETETNGNGIRNTEYGIKYQW